MKYSNMTIKEEEEIAVQAIKNGFYIKNNENEIFFVKNGLCIYPNGQKVQDDSKYILFYEDSHFIICNFCGMYDNYSYIDTYTFDTYGTDWALIKEELK